MSLYTSAHRALLPSCMCLHCLWFIHLCVRVFPLSVAACLAVCAAHVYGFVLMPVRLLLCLPANSMCQNTIWYTMHRSCLHSIQYVRMYTFFAVGLQSTISLIYCLIDYSRKGQKFVKMFKIFTLLRQKTKKTY